jgi:hypothetical protein
MSIEKFNDLIGNRTRHLPACNIVPQPTILPRAPTYNVGLLKFCNIYFKLIPMWYMLKEVKGKSFMICSNSVFAMNEHAVE